MKGFTKINLNDRVRFRLTSHGESYMRKLPQRPYFLSAEGGYFETQLWELMRVFGPHLHMGFDNLIESDLFVERGSFVGQVKRTAKKGRAA